MQHGNLEHFGIGESEMKHLQGYQYKPLQYNTVEAYIDTLANASFRFHVFQNAPNSHVA